VILCHFESASEFLKGAPKILTAGGHMVTFFFVLSGFSLILAYYNKTVFSYKEYWAKRATRIVPVYLLAVVLSIMVMIRYGQKLSPVELILHLSFMQSWNPYYPISYTFNYPAWAVSDLFFFYLTFPSILSYIKISSPDPRRFLLWALLLWLVTQIIILLLCNASFCQGLLSSSDHWFIFPPLHYCSFLLGVATGYLIIKGNDSHWTPTKSIILISISIFLVILVTENELLIKQFIKLKFPVGMVLYAPLFMFLIFSLSKSNVLFANLLTSKPIALLGEISFSIYILHAPFSHVTSYIFNNYTHIISYDVRLLIYIFILIIFGVFLNYAVEQPIKVAVKNKLSFAGNHCNGKYS
jgi:peptidoglycan/LPS O-acetylase OafA/YrhL